MVSEHGVTLDNVKIVTVENRKFESGVKEAINIRIAESSLNKDVRGNLFQQCGLRW